MYLKKIPRFLQFLFKGCVFNLEKENVIYLTFDDGPNPNSTPSILKKLKDSNAKATFFCLGKNASNYPVLFEKIISDNHAIGNHGFQHLDGWRTSFKDYIHNVSLANKYTNSTLFRPPYGRLTPKQYHYLKNRYRIILWDTMPGDFDENSKDIIANNINLKLTSGSIVVLHDNPKHLNFTLKVLDHIIESYTKDFSFQVIELD